MADSPEPAPYQEIFADLLASVMRAQAEVAEQLTTVKLAKIPDASINRHFAWLTFVYDDGENRHLFESVSGTFPIRTMPLRQRNQIHDDILRLLKERQPLDPSAIGGRDAKGNPVGPFVQPAPTRISRLIKASFVHLSSIIEGRETPDEPDTSVPNNYGTSSKIDVRIRSPLSIVYDYLTIPTMPASRAYVLLPIRNFLFESFGTFPALDTSPTDGNGSVPANFSVSDVEAGLSRIWTSLRTRHFSRGRDTLPPEGRSSVDGMLRHFFAATDVLWLRFQDLNSCHAYLADAELRPEDPAFSFVRSDHLDDDRLPDLGQLINELWGLPIPIRGADTLFRGGLKFSSGHGLVVGIHGGPGTGKTSLALALGAVLAPFGIRTLFITAEETFEDLKAKAENMVADELRRLSFFPENHNDWLTTEHLIFDSTEDDEPDPFQGLETALRALAEVLEPPSSEDQVVSTAKPCRAIVVLDGIHDLIMAVNSAKGPDLNAQSLALRLRHFILACRKLRALVLVTAGEHWGGERALDYLVDVALRLTHESVGEYGRKPDRRVTLTKARHQISAAGTHGLQIAGAKGMRFSPQISYQLDRKALWRTRLPEMDTVKQVLMKTLPYSEFDRFQRRDVKSPIPRMHFGFPAHGVRIFRGSNIFLNGEGSGGKAALALKIAISPTFEADGKIADRPEKILIVSFLYPSLYYDNIRDELLRVRRLEYDIGIRDLRPVTKVIHLYPGNYMPDQLFNRVEWELDAADLHGEPYTAMVIDGLHNVFLQFPEIEAYTLFWPQLYAALRTRSITIISTHTTFVLEGTSGGEGYRLDDRRSEPLRHALVQKTDFRFEIDPVEMDDTGTYVKTTTSNIFGIRTVAAINQPLPKVDLLWSRDKLVLFEAGQGALPLGGDPRRRRT